MNGDETYATWGVFISYSRSDRNIVAPIVELMRVTGIRVFRDEDSIAPGKRWRIMIAESLSAAKTAVVFWCAHSAGSDAVKLEYKTAIELNKDVVPILLDDTALNDELREYQWIDFRPFTSVNDTHNRVSILTDVAAAAAGRPGTSIAGATASGMAAAAGTTAAAVSAGVDSVAAIAPLAFVGALIGAGVYYVIGKHTAAPSPKPMTLSKPHGKTGSEKNGTNFLHNYLILISIYAIM